MLWWKLQGQLASTPWSRHKYGVFACRQHVFSRKPVIQHNRHSSLPTNWLEYGQKMDQLRHRIMQLENPQSQEDSLETESTLLQNLEKDTSATHQSEPPQEPAMAPGLGAKRHKLFRPPPPLVQAEEATQAYEARAGPWQASSEPAEANPRTPLISQSSGPDSPMKSISKREMYRYVVIDTQSEEAPLRQQGWAAWLQAIKGQARPPINFWADPAPQQGDIFRLQGALKPIRGEMAQTEKQGLYTDKLFDGWMPSRLFYAIAEHKGNPSTVYLSLAISIIQFPPLREHSGGHVCIPSRTPWCQRYS